MNCYFFGTFNPPHLGHILLAQSVKQEFCFEKIVFVPAFSPPHKETLDFFHRYNMLKLAVDPSFGEVSDIESKLPVPSFSFRTINKIYENSKPKELWDGKIPFITGYDAIMGIENWKNPGILKEKLKFIVLKRHSGTTEADIFALSDKGYDFVLSKSKYFDIESAKIRKMVSRGEDIKNFVDKNIEGYINEHRLYR